jgi:hypothetical protein
MNLTPKRALEQFPDKKLVGKKLSARIHVPEDRSGTQCGTITDVEVDAAGRVYFLTDNPDIMRVKAVEVDAYVDAKPKDFVIARVATLVEVII